MYCFFYRGDPAVLLPDLRHVRGEVPGADGIPGEIPGPAAERLPAARADVRRTAAARLARPRPAASA